MVVGIGANAWLNTLVAFRLYQMLLRSAQNKRVQVPSRRQVIKEVIVVYAYCMCLASLGLIKNDWLPYHIGTGKGLGCIPVQVDLESSLFFWLCFCPLFVFIPIFGIVWITWQVYKQKLLPRTGRIRQLSLFFMRLIFIFLLFWVPTALLKFLFGPFLDPWVEFAAGSWSHMQGVSSAILTFLKPDIAEATKQMLYSCFCCAAPSEEGTGNETEKESKALGESTKPGCSKIDDPRSREPVSSTYRIRAQAPESAPDGVDQENDEESPENGPSDSLWSTPAGQEGVSIQMAQIDEYPLPDTDNEKQNVSSSSAVGRVRSKHELEELKRICQTEGLAAARDRGYSVREAARYLLDSLEEQPDQSDSTHL